MATQLSLEIDAESVSAHHALIFQAWRCVIGDARVTYVSGPITTGSLWINAVETGETVARTNVIAINSQHLIEAAATLRSDSARLVIEPASLSVRGWSQSDYLTLWTNLIERHAGEVRFLPDWSYSNGCAHEFERAIRHNIPTLTFDGQEIGRREGVEALRKARNELLEKSRKFKALSPLRDAIADVVLRMTTSA